jgi:acyl carrier protein
MTHEEWTSTFDPKVTGTWNLHHAVEGLDLDFFVMFGSTSGIVGIGGQTNYSAANTFLNSFARYRRQQGLVASVVNPSLVEEIGIVRQHPEYLERAHRAHILLLSEIDVLNGVHLAIRDSRGESAGECSFSIGVGYSESLPQSNVKSIWGHDARFSLYRHLQCDVPATRTQGSEDRLRAILGQVDKDPPLLNNAEITDAIKSELAKAVTTGIASHQDMDEEQQNGVVIDSLMAIEIRTSFRRDLKVDIPSAEITKAGTVGELCNLFVRHMRLRYGLDEATPAAA